MPKLQDITQLRNVYVLSPDKAYYSPGAAPRDNLVIPMSASLGPY